jgi:hypothetical protein
MAQFRNETVNGIDVLFDNQGRFNVSKLVKRYQPQNIHINRYIQSKKFAELFGAKSLEYQQQCALPLSGMASDRAIRAMQPGDLTLQILSVNKGVGDKHRGLYLPREFLHIILMMLDPNYRSFANALLETANIVNNGVAPTVGDLSITSKTNERTVEVIDWEHYRAPYPNHRQLPENCTAYQIEKDAWDRSQNDKMW